MSDAAKRDSSHSGRGEGPDSGTVSGNVHLADAAMSLLECRSAGEVFDVIEGFMGQLLPDAIVIVNEATDDYEWLITRKITGLDGSLLARVQESVGFEIIGKRSAVLPAYRDWMFGSTLVKLPGGFAELASGEIHRDVAATVEKLFGIRDVFTIGISDREQVLGNIHVLTTTPDTVVPARIIESFARHSFSALTAISGVQELAKTKWHSKLLFDSKAEGFALHEIILDETGKACDYRFLDFSPAFEEMTGLKAKDVIGRTVLEVLPGTESYWIERYGAVATTGIPTRFEEYSGEIGKHFSVVAYSPEPDLFATLVSDITDRKKAEELANATHAQLLAIFDSIDEPVYVADPDTHEMLYVNQAIERVLGSFGSQKCFEYLQDRDVPCPFCTNSLILGAYSGCSYVWEFKNEVNERWYRCIDKAIPWPDGRTVRYEMAIDITAAREAEEAIKASEQKYRFLTESMNDLIWTTDLELNRTYTSSSIEKVLGFTVEEAMNQKLEERILPESMRMAKVMLVEELRHDEERDPDRHIHLEIDYYHKDGSARCLEQSLSFIRDESGRPIGIRGLGRDITDRKRMEDALRHSEERLGLAMEVKSEGVWDWNLVTNETVFDERYYTLAGYAPGEFPEDFAGWAEHVHPDDLPGAEAAIKAYLCGESDPFDIEFRFKRKDESWIWIQGRGKVVEWDEAGEPLRMIGTHTEITERKQAEEAVLESEQTLKNILELTLSGYWDWNLVDNTEYLSPTFKRMFGYEDHEMESSPEAWRRIVFPEDLPGVLESFDRHVTSRGREPFYREVRYRHRDGSTVWVICAGRVIEWAEDGTAIRMVGCHIDITDRKQAEAEVRRINATLEQTVHERTEELQATAEELEAVNEELEAVNEELLEVNEAKTRFLRSMSHELRTPLNSVIGFSGIMLKGVAGEINDEQRRQLEMIRHSGQHLLELINDILDLSRIEAGKTDVQIERFDVAKVAHQALQAVTPAAEKKGLAVRLELPEGEDAIEIVCDCVKVRQILLNLLGNAVKFTESGSVELRVARGAPGMVAISVKDNGPGIHEEDHEHIFGEFSQRRRDSAPEHEGTGLGLAISRRLALLLGGAITLKSEVGKGSTFTLLLPEEPGPQGR